MITPILASFLLSAVAAVPAPDAKAKPVRVLLAAGGPTREYQFVRTLFVREADRKQAELSIYLQGTRKEGVVQDVPSERLLPQFPVRLRALDQPEEEKERPLNLLRYDVIIAFDLDWLQLTAEQLALLEQWVSKHGGGLILVGGPLNTYHLGRAIHKERLKSVLELCPAILGDNRIRDIDRTADQPQRLNFPGANAEMTFLRLDEASRNPLAGWEDYFTGPRKEGEKPELQRGFYNYYPVQRVKEGATVIATFTDPRARLADGKEHPILVSASYGKGRVVWLGCSEMWRLRLYRTEFHERFWGHLARYAGSLPAPVADKNP